MSWRCNLAKLAALFRRPQTMNDLEEEIRTHLQMEEQENLESGMAPDEARYAALRRFGNVALAQQKSREMWVWNRAETIRQDLGFGLRQLKRSPAFAAVAVLTLALGIGANTAIFQMLDAVRLRSLPVMNPQELVDIRIVDNPYGRTGDFVSSSPQLTNAIWEQLRDKQQAFSRVAAWGL